MAYKCLDCGHIFEDGEQARWEETHGFDTPPYEQRSGCPLCKGEYEKTIKCGICRGEFTEDELSGGVCNDCIDQHKSDFETCKKIGDADQQEIKLNGFFVSYFGKNEIESILYDFIKEKCVGDDFSEYINEDKDWFAERLVKLKNANL